MGPSLTWTKRPALFDEKEFGHPFYQTLTETLKKSIYHSKKSEFPWVLTLKRCSDLIIK